METPDVIIVSLLILLLVIFLFCMVVYFVSMNYQKNVLSQQLYGLEQIIQKNNNLTTSYNVEKDTSIKRMPINIPTRQVESFKQVGILSNNDNDSNKPIIIPLYGRRVYNGSSQWNYYTTTDGFRTIELSVFNKNKDCFSEYGCDEIYNGDTITVPGYSSQFNVSMYERTGPRYIPYVS
jgi:hypothetical protein